MPPCLDHHITDIAPFSIPTQSQWPSHTTLLQCTTIIKSSDNLTSTELGSRYKFPLWGYFVGIITVIIFSLIFASTCAEYRRRYPGPYAEHNFDHNPDHEDEGDSAADKSTEGQPLIPANVSCGANTDGQDRRKVSGYGGIRSMDGSGSHPGSRTRYSESGMPISNMVLHPKRAFLAHRSIRNTDWGMLRRGLPGGILLDVEMGILKSQWRNGSFGSEDRSRSESMDESGEVGIEMGILGTRAGNTSLPVREVPERRREFNIGHFVVSGVGKDTRLEVTAGASKSENDGGGNGAGIGSIQKHGSSTKEIDGNPGPDLERTLAKPEEAKLKRKGS